LRQISTEDAASVLAGGLAMAGIDEQERLRLVAETERILDELDGKSVRETRMTRPLVELM
jgi:hypothetical protein